MEPKSAYYYVRDHEMRPVVTVCLMKIGTVVSRGMAICSLRDQPCKKTGRRLARNMCLRAFGKKKSGCPVLRDKANGILYALDDQFIRDLDFKSEYHVEPLNDFEAKIIKNL